ncbi:MAG: hypothetical protein AAF492_13885, partial [Verrucomicrobiota bacterium]
KCAHADVSHRQTAVVPVWAAHQTDSGCDVGEIGSWWRGLAQLSREIGASLFMAGLTLLVVGFLVNRSGQVLLKRPRPRVRSWLIAAGLGLGLLGPLLIGLMTVRLFQLDGLRPLYNTPLPLLLALTLILFPLALLLKGLFIREERTKSSHSASLLNRSPLAPLRANARQLHWRLVAQPRLWLAGLIFYWAYFDLTASSLLAPTSMQPVFARLYNFMHYGQSELLSSMLLVAVLLPLFAMGLAGLAAKRWGPAHG